MSSYQDSNRASRSSGVSASVLCSSVSSTLDGRFSDPQHERAAHGVQRALEGRDGHLVAGRLEPRDRRLGDAQPAGEGGLGQALRLAGLRIRSPCS